VPNLEHGTANQILQYYYG